MRQKFSEPQSLRRTLLTVFFLSVLICFAVGLYNFLSIRFLLSDMAAFVDSSSRLSAVQSEIQALQDDIDEYLFSRNTDALKSYHIRFEKVKTAADELLVDVVYNDHGIKLKNLGMLTYRYLDNATKITRARTNEKTDQYVSLYSDVVRDFSVITENIQSILVDDLQESALQYEQMQTSIQWRTALSYILFTVSIVLVVISLYSLSNQVTGPISRLAGYARQVADGDYGLTVKDETNSQELTQLYEAFIIMVENTRLYLEGIEERQSLENELNQEKIKGLEMNYLLQQTQLQALHAQINPHFIFNTINIGAQLANLEGKGRTRSYLENAAQVFRYNLEGLGNTTLSTELEHVSAYMSLLTIRFGHKLRYNQIVDDGIDPFRYTLPRMTLQPLVENAFVHGISSREDGGEIALVVSAGKKGAIVTISNTGDPFPLEKIEALKLPQTENESGHASGIGLRNVIKRLQLHFQIETPIEIVSENGLTTVTLIIPTN